MQSSLVATDSPSVSSATQLNCSDCSDRNYRFRSLRGVYAREFGVKALLVICGLLSVFTSLAIVVVLFSEASRFFHADDLYCDTLVPRDGTSEVCGAFIATSTAETAGEQVACPRCAANHELPAEVSFVQFFTSTEWNPLIGRETDKHFGVWALVSGTLMISLIAMTVAIPLGLVTAIYLSEYAHPRVRAVVKPTLEVLAGIPTVVYGFFALTVITPVLRVFHDGFNAFNATAAGLAVGILCLPIISSLVEDALRAVPRSLREGAYGLGATKFEVSTKVVLPAALSGIIAAFLLAISRTVGETMVVALAAGSRPHLTLDPRDDTQTMTGWMVQMALGDNSNFDMTYLSMYAVAAVLFLMTLGLTLLGHMVRKRFREEYQ